MADPTDTFDALWTQAGLPSDGDPSETYGRVETSVPPMVEGLPVVEVGGRRLRLVERIGQGGMGVVDAMQDLVLDRTVAVKRPRPGSGPRGASALVAEARVLAALDHPSIVPVHALARAEDGEPALLMKRIEGRPWSQLERDFDRDLDIALEVAAALGFAHARGWLHRDVKPANVMVGAFGEVYLMDWGCACRLEDAVTREVVGTPALMAPEMTRVGAPIGPTVDVFLLGASLHRLFTGRHRNDGADLREVLRIAAVGANPAWPDHVPADVRAVIDRACAPRPEDRHPDMPALVAALRGLREHRAAGRLLGRATLALGALRRAVEAGDPAAETSFSEAVLGYAAAREAWPGLAEADGGERAAWDLYVPWKLAMGDVEAVARILPEAPDPARWEGALAEARARVDAVARERLAWDGRVGAATRTRFALGMIGMAGVAVAIKGTATPTAAELVGLGTGTFVAATLVLLVWRRVLLDHPLSRGLAGGLVFLTGISLVQRALALLDGAPVERTLRTDLLLFGVGTAVVAALRDRRLFLPALPFFVGLGVPASGHAVGAVFPVAALTAAVLHVVVFARADR